MGTIAAETTSFLSRLSSFYCSCAAIYTFSKSGSPALYLSTLSYSQPGRFGSSRMAGSKLDIAGMATGW